MKTFALTGIRKMEMRDAPMPKIVRDTDVLLRVAAVGVCGSDVHYYTTGRIGSQVVQYPFTVGHECAATVERVGAGVKRVEAGDRVAVEPAMSCGHCDQCRAGRQHTCRTLSFLGCPGQAEGCLSEFIVMPEACCFPIPDSMSIDQAVLSEPLAIGVYAVKRSVPMAGARIGILGAGPIGLSVLLPARAQGAAAVYVTDLLDYRLDAARRAGATWAGHPGKEDVVQTIAGHEPLLLDVVFECCGEQAAIDQAIDLLKPGGKLMLIGIPTTDRISLTIDKARRKELCIQNVRRQNHCVQATLDMLAEGAIDADFMITHRVPFSGTAAAFDQVEHYRDGVIKALVTMP